MLPLSFFGQNFHFALNLFFSLAAFATFWLYFDAWLVSRQSKEISKWLGFLLLSVSFVFQALLIEQSLLGSSILGNLSEAVAVLIRLIAYGLIIYGLIIEPLQKVPKAAAPKSAEKSAATFSLGGWLISLKLLLPLGAGTIALLFYRKTTLGLERHLKGIAYAFFFLFLSEVAGLASLFRDSDNINLYNLTAFFGPMWLLEQAFLLVATLLLGSWVWSYLVKRVQSQLFMIFTTSTLIIFLVISICFTFLLVKNIQTETLASLETAAKVLNYSLDSKKSEVIAQAEVFSENPLIKQAVITKNHDQLSSLIDSSLENKKISSIVITDINGQVLVRTEEPEKWGDSLSSDILVRKALNGKVDSSFVSKQGIIAPTIYLQAARPINQDSQVIGSILIGVAISNNFLDGIKESTGLDAAVYSGNVRSATTLVQPNGKDRWVGVKEENKQVKNQVLEEGKTFKGSLSNLNRPFLAVYQPLKNLNQETIGMIFTGQPQILILQSAGRSIELTFILAVVLLLLSIIPAYLISKYISNQIH